MTTTTTDNALFEVLRSALVKSDMPLTLANLKKSLPNPYKKQVTSAVLEELVAAGQCFLFKKGKSVSFGLKSLATLTRDAILEDIAQEPESWTNLKKRPRIKVAAGLQTAKELDAAREKLIDAGRVFEWPKSGTKGIVRYSDRPVDARQFLDESKAFETAKDKFLGELRKLAGALSKSGLTEAEVRRSAFSILTGEAREPVARTPNLARKEEVPYSPELATFILDRMIDEEPAAANGAPVSIRNLRRAAAFQIPAKQVFDDTLRGMAAEGVLCLHWHDFPGGLSDFEREELVPDGRGGYYIAVSRRA